VSLPDPRTTCAVQPIDVIINADDLGLHPAVRRAVEELASAGALTSASMLANGPDQAALRPYPGLSLGAHLNILRGAPISPAREVASLVGAEGLFLGSVRALVWRAMRGQLVPAQVRLEWSRQVAHLRARGIAVSHLDGEKHTHLLPGLFEAACDVAREHGIAWVRRSDERWGAPVLSAGAVRRAVLRALAARAHTGPMIRATDAVWGIAHQGDRLTAAAFARAMEGRSYARGPRRVVEVICHPGREMPGDPALPAAFGRMRVRSLWEPEFRSLSSGAWTAAAAANNWRLTSFDRLLQTSSDDR
jgi:predicted glycoside hydrolase/deacetylase ChbG (UPF0249 family)